MSFRSNVTSFFLLAAVTILFQPGAKPQATSASGSPASSAKPAKEKEETSRISGTVVKMADGAPLKNALVQLINNEDREHTIATKTGPDGRFELRNLPSGRYKLKVTRNGYVENEFGQVKPTDPGATFTLSPGEDKPPILFKMIPSAVISGRVFDEDGEPMQQVAVMASKEVFEEGRRRLRGSSAVMTDDLGQFRLFGLAPGRYFVSATKMRWNDVAGDREFQVASNREQEKGYVKTYYPGTPDMAKAGFVSVKEGEEIAGTDIQLKQTAVYRVRGKVLNLITHKGGANAFLQLMPRTKRLEWDFGNGQQVQKSDGSFEFANVVPGSYLLQAFWEDKGTSYSTQERVEVGEGDVEGITLQLGPGATIQGRVRWEGKPSLERDELSVSVQPSDTPFMWQGSSSVESDQQFTVKNVGDGEYKVTVSGLGKDCYVKDTVYGDTHSVEGVITVGKGGGAPLEIVISSRGSRVQGAVVDKDGLPAAGVWVVAVPDEARRNISRLFKEQTTDQYGKFDLHGLAPGSYKIFSWTGVERGEWEDPDFLKAFEGKGESVELADEDVKAVNLTVIEKKSERE